MATVSTLVELDARGVAWLSGANVKVIEVVMDKMAHGWSPEEIHFQHPNLSLAQIHAAFAYYYENQAAMDARIADDALRASEMARGQVGSALTLKLRKAKSSL